MFWYLGSDLNFDNFNGNGAVVIQSDGSPTVVVHYDDIKLVGASSGGGGGSSDANPHAATTIAGVTQTYDDNGNLIANSDGLSNTWNYRNELISSAQNGETTTFTYDHTGQRIGKVHGTSTTYYPSSLYEVKNGEATKHIYLDDMLVATIEADTPAPSLYYNHLDHLGSTNAVTGEDGYLNQLLAYYPFGNSRIDNQYDTINQTNRFTGHDYDEETSLSYMGARYYSGETGRFTSQDPLHIRLDRPNLLTNPQKLNSYSYVENNPLIKFDPNGESSAMTFMNMQRVDNLSGGYISSQNRVYAEQAPRAAIAAGLTVVAVPAAAGAMSVAPYATIGALSNMGAASVIDVASDGSFDMSGQELATHGVIGGVGGQFTAGRGLLGVGSIAAGDSVVSQTFTGDGMVSGREVLVDTGVAVGLHGVRLNSAGSHSLTSQPSYGSSIGEVLANISAKVAAWSAFLSGESNDKVEDDDR